MGRLGESRLSGWIARRRLDRVTAVLGLLLAAAIFPLQLFVSHIYATTLPVVLGAASLLYLLATRNDTAFDYPLSQLSVTGGRLVEATVLFGIAGLFVFAGVVGKRTILFYDLAGLVGSIILLQILFVDRDALRPPVVLVEILALAIVLRYAGLYSLAGFIGIDVWSHVAYVREIRTTGTLATLNSKYVASPLYHLLVAVTADLTGLPVRGSLYLSVGLAVVLSTAFVYYGARRFTEPRWALLAIGLYSMAAQVVRWGLHLIPTSLGLAFFVVLAVYLVRVLQEYRSRDVGMLAVLVVAVTLSHQLSAFVTLVVLGLAVLTQIVLHWDTVAPDATPVNVTGLFMFAVGFVVLDWSVTPYSGRSFTTTMLLRLRNTLFRQIGLLDVSSTKNVASTAGEAGTSLLTKLVAYINVFGFLALLFIAGLGTYYVLQRRNRTHARLFQVGTTGVMSVFVLALPILGVSLFLPGRWYAFMYVPMTILGVLGLRYVAHHLDRRAVAVGLALMMLVYPSIMFVSGAATLDSPVFDSKQQRIAFTETEIDAVETIDDMLNEQSNAVFTDAPYTAVFLRTTDVPAGPLRVPRGGQSQNELVVYRTYQSTGASLITNGNGSSRLAQVERSQVCSPTRSRLYANGDVSLCRQRDG